MFRELSKKELDIFVDKYFKNWKNDIYKVTCIKYKNSTEYLVNEHYIFY